MCVVVCVCVCACMARRHKEGPCINPSAANRKLSPLAVNRTVLCFPSTACVRARVCVSGPLYGRYGVYAAAAAQSTTFNYVCE